MINNSFDITDVYDSHTLKLLEIFTPVPYQSYNFTEKKI